MAESPGARLPCDPLRASIARSGPCAAVTGHLATRQGPEAPENRAGRDLPLRRTPRLSAFFIASAPAAGIMGALPTPDLDRNSRPPRKNSALARVKRPG